MGPLDCGHCATAGRDTARTMSQENLEVARRFMELGRRGDWSRLEMLAEDVVYRPIAEITEAGEYRGRHETQ